MIKVQNIKKMPFTSTACEGHIEEEKYSSDRNQD